MVLNSSQSVDDTVKGKCTEPVTNMMEETELSLKEENVVIAPILVVEPAQIVSGTNTP